MSNCKIYRFKFSDDVTQILSDFAKLHAFDAKEQLKTCFEELWENSRDVFRADLERLTHLGMDDDNDGYKVRVFRSMKYYHIKKIKNESGNKSMENEINKENRKKKEKSHRFSKRMIDAIETAILKEIELNLSFKPSLHMVALFDNPDFKMLMQEEQRRFRIMEQDKNHADESNTSCDNDDETFMLNFNSRLKKLYQNRYFNISSNVQ